MGENVRKRFFYISKCTCLSSRNVILENHLLVVLLTVHSGGSYWSGKVASSNWSGLTYWLISWPTLCSAYFTEQFLWKMNCKEKYLNSSASIRQGKLHGKKFFFKQRSILILMYLKQILLYQFLLWYRLGVSNWSTFPLPILLSIPLLG